MIEVLQHIAQNEQKNLLNKDARSRVERFLLWCSQNNIQMTDSLFSAYVDYLRQEGFAPNTIKAHISSIRGWIGKIIESGELRAELSTRIDPSFGEQKRQLHLEAKIGQVRAALESKRASVRVASKPSRNLYLTAEEISRWVNSFPVESLLELRDFAIVSLILATGLREAEVCALDVKDFGEHEDRKRGVQVPNQPGCVERWIPYEHDVRWVDKVISTWLKAAHIDDGAVFRGLYKSGNMIRNERVNVRTITRILTHYPMVHYDQAIILKPLDLRHTYARHLYQAHHHTFESVQAYLGLKTTTAVVNHLGKAYRIYQDPQDNPFYVVDLSRLANWR
ncbi:MAG: tyrosine-type recombinase/integrase [Anaerolineae bacterium]